SKLNHPAHRYLCLRFKRHLAMSPARLEARMDSLLSFPVGLFHPLQHAGLSRRSPRIPFLRWDEKAGLRRDAVRSQWSTRSKRKRKETGYEKDYHCAGIQERNFQGTKADDRPGSGRSLVVLLCYG